MYNSQAAFRSVMDNRNLLRKRSFLNTTKSINKEAYQQIPKTSKNVKKFEKQKGIKAANFRAFKEIVFCVLLLIILGSIAFFAYT